MKPTEFWNHVDKSNTDGCWPWQLAVGECGYGNVNINGWYTRAHRVAYAFANGGIPPGKVVRHTCDNPPCCNPAHLFTGTQATNMQDAVSKGRTAIGVEHGLARLNDQKVAEIRAKYRPYVHSMRLLGEEYGVAEGTIKAVISGKTWRHVGLG